LQISFLIDEVLEAHGIIDGLNGFPSLFPESGERTSLRKCAASAGLVRLAIHRVERPLHEANDLADRDPVRRGGEVETALGTSAGIDQSSGFEFVQDDLEEPLGRRLTAGDFGGGNRSLAISFGQFEDGSDGVLAFLLKNHGWFSVELACRCTIMRQDRRRIN